MYVHPDFRDLQSLVDEELSPVDRHQIRRHLEECESCRDAAGMLRCVARSMAAIDRVEAPGELPDRILAACAQAAPVPAISCEAALAMASEYADGELSGLQRDTLESHLFSCEFCYVAFRRMERTVEVLRETPRAVAPAGLEERIHAAIEREKTPAEPVFAWRRSFGVVAGMAAAAAVLLAVFIPRGTEQIGTPESHVAAVQIEETAEPIAEAVTEETVAPGAEEAIDEAAAASSDPETDSAVMPPQSAADVRRPAARTPARTAPSPAPRTEPAPEPRTASPQPSPDARPAAELGRSSDISSPATVDPHPVSADERARPASTPGEEPAPPRESVIAREPQPGPVSQPESPVMAAPSQPAPETSAQPVTDGDREDVRIAVVPVHSEARTLYRASDEPSMDRISRATRAVNSGVSRQWSDAPTGMDLR